MTVQFLFKTTIFQGNHCKQSIDNYVKSYYITTNIKSYILPQKALFITVPVFFVVAYFYTAVRLWKILPAVYSLKFLLAFIFFLGIAGVVLFFSYGENMPIRISGLFYRFSTSWLIAFLYLFIAVMLIDVFRLTNVIFHFFEKDAIRSVFNNNLITSISIFSLVGIILIIGNINYHNKKRQQITISSEKIDKPLKIVGISDLHIGYTISVNEVKKWVNMINSESPDMVIISGDIIDNHMRPVMNDSIENVLRKIEAPMGVFACTGNHDLMFAVKEDQSFFKRSGINLLRDSFININGVTIIGRDDLSNENRAELKHITKSVDRSTFTILLDHQPANLDEAIANNINLQLSGHTHRGQVFPISLITDAIFELSHGYMKKEGTHFYVSSGIGIWGGKFRIGTRSEYLIIDLQPS